MRILMLTACFISCLLCTSAQGQNKQDVFMLCEQMLGALPSADSIDIQVSKDAGQATFVFSLPSQELKGSVFFSDPLLVRTGVPCVKVIVIPKYSPNHLQQLKSWNGEIKKNDKGSSHELFLLPVFGNEFYGFHVETPTLVPTSVESRKILARQMSLVFSKTDFLEIGPSTSRDDFWDHVMNLTHDSRVMEAFLAVGEESENSTDGGKRPNKTKQKSQEP